MTLDRAVDSQGTTREFRLSATRDAEAATRFFLKARHATAGAAPQARPLAEPVAQPTAGADPNTLPSAPRVSNGDKKADSPKAIAALKATGALPEQVELRQVKYLTNLGEQDQRFLKRLVQPGMGFFSVETAGNTVQGDEGMNRLRKGQVRGVEKGNVTRQISGIARLFAGAA